ncbi:hypothetical protein, partial [Actinosynnema sp.]|uniref:hypothetical protein n=1 Tax=Actinosynnema sp. TaxID=1872144 RepID=UPI003F853A0D
REEVPRWLIRSGDEPAIACYAAHLDGKILRVPLLRTSHHRLSDTIARQLLWLLRRDARKHGAQVIDISDRHTDEVTARAMSSAPFHEHDGHQYAWVVHVCGTNQEIDLAADAARELVGLGRGPLLRPGLPARTASEVERSLWPAKLTDSELPHYVIPVQPRWSSDLLGHPLQLTSRRIELSLGRGQVYYRSADNLLTAPARIIWRVSKGRHTAAEIIGTSFLDTITTGTPKRLHATFEHYGVLDLDQLEKQADGKQLMQALQFSDTELFERPISTRTYEQLKARHGGPENFPGPRSITPELFAALYKAGNE